MGVGGGQGIACSFNLRVPMGIARNRAAAAILAKEDGSKGSLSGVSLERFIQLLRDLGLHSGFFDFIYTMDIKNGDIFI